MKTLIIHHLEKTWEEGYDTYGTCFYDLAEEVIAHIKKVGYDRVILTQFENFKPQEEHFNSGLVEFVTDWFEYGYGWEKTGEEKYVKKSNIYCDNWGNIYTEGGNHSQLVLIPDWMKSLKGTSVYICGAFDGECIEDLEIALTASKINFSRVEHLIVGQM